MNIAELKAELAALLNSQTVDDKPMYEMILAAHMRDVCTGFINRDNSHLFRMYRNNVSTDPTELMKERYTPEATNAYINTH